MLRLKNETNVVSHRVLVRRARKLAQQYYLVYQEPIPTGQLVQRVASVMQEYTQSGWVKREVSQCKPSVLWPHAWVNKMKYFHSEVTTNMFFLSSSGVRPFGVSLLIAGWDEDHPYLFQSDPSVRWITTQTCHSKYIVVQQVQFSKYL